MFDTGSATVKDYTRDIMHAIGGLLNGVDNAISLAGHTDSKAYAGGERGYSNWELSADRANASRRELVAGGMNESKVLRVVGLSSSLPLDSANPLNPMNRRISLVVLNEKTERQIRGLPEEPMQEIENEVDAAKALGLDGGAAPESGAAPDGGARRRPARPAPAEPPAPARDERLAAAAGRRAESDLTLEPQQQRFTPLHLRCCSARKNSARLSGGASAAWCARRCAR